MARIVSPGTFVYVRGNMLLDGWVVDCEGGDALTQPEMIELVLKYITALVVEVPALAAQIAAADRLRYIARRPEAGDA